MTTLAIPRQAAGRDANSWKSRDAAEGSPAFDIQWINGGLVVRPRVADLSSDAQMEPLTSREHEVLALVAEGNSNKRIADCLCITERTVKSHLTCIMAKLHAFDRTHAVVKAIRRGWLAV